MTTTVRIDAHCASTKEVVVVLYYNGLKEEIILNDGQGTELYVYDDRKISVREREMSDVT